MAQPWVTLDRVATAEGPLELRQRGRDFFITVAGRVLMTSTAHRSEDVLATAACAALAGRARPRVLVGGLGMGLTLRAALDALPPEAAVQVAELNPRVIAWCRGPLAPLGRDALADPRVTVTAADVAAVIGAARGLDAIVLDLYEGPHAATQGAADPLYGGAALARVAHALAPGGVFAVWSEEPDRDFERRLRGRCFSVDVRRARGGRAHVVYLARRETSGAAAGAGRRSGR
jgi:spermidine synthase